MEAQLSRLRLAGWILLVLVLVLVIGPTLVPDGVLSRPIETQAKRFTGRDLTIEGGVTLRLLPRPMISLQKIRLSNPTDGLPGPMLSAYRLAIYPQLISLFTGKPIIDEIDLELPEFNLSTSVDGRPNWRFVRPERADLNRASRFAFELISAAHAETAENPQPSSRQPPSVPVRSLRIANGRINYQAAGTDKHAILDGMMLDVEIPSTDAPIRLNGSALWLGSRTRLALGLDSMAGLFSQDGSKFGGNLHSAIGNLDIEGRAVLGGPPRADLSLDLTINAGIPPDLVPGGIRRLVAALNEERTPSASMRVGLDGSKISIKSANIQFGSLLALEGDLDFDTASQNRQLSARINIDHLDADRLGRKPKPAVIDPQPNEAYADYLERLEKPTPAKAPRDWSAKPIRLDFLRNMEIDATISLRNATIRNSRLGPSRLKLAAKDEQASLAADISLENGTTKLRTTIDLSDHDRPKADVELDAKQFSLDSLLEGERSPIKAGTVDLSAKLSSQGVSERELVSNLAGSLALSLEQGALRLYRIGPRWLQGFISNVASCPAVIDRAHLEARLAVASGVVAMETLTLASPDVNIVASGRVDIPARNVDVRIGGGPLPCIRPTHATGIWNAPAFSPNSR